MPSAVVAAIVEELSAPALVTAGYVIMGMHFMPLGPTSGMVGANDAQKKWGDRTFLNMMEHAPLFLSSLYNLKMLYGLLCFPFLLFQVRTSPPPSSASVRLRPPSPALSRPLTPSPALSRPLTPISRRPPLPGALAR